MNPYYKLSGLQSLWEPLPREIAERYFEDAQEGLQTLWSQQYRNREIPGEQPLIPRPPHSLNRRLRWAATSQASQTAGSQDATSQITAYEAASSRAASQATSQSQRNSRNRGQQHEPAPLPLDELEIYLREPVIDPELFKEDAISWWREVGSKRFPRLSLLASDLLSIPSSTSSIERQFNSTGAMVTPKRSSLSRVTICQAQSLKSWRQQRIYTANADWERALPIE
jgi:hypothetical protein